MSDKTILIVDADNVSLNYLMRIVKEQHYSAVGVGSGKEGLVATWRDQPDLIIFDPTLGDLSPEEFLLKLRRDLRSVDIPILALSTNTDVAMRDACIQAGCNEYMLKSGEVVAALPGTIGRMLGKEPEVVQEIPQKQPDVAPETAQELVKEGGYLIVFLSAKGGTGTSSLCANYAMSIHHTKPEASVVVADLVLPIGSIAPIVGYEGEIDLVSVASLPSEETTGEYFHKRLPKFELWDFQLLAGASDPERANELQIQRIPEIIDALQQAYDFVFVDLGRSLSRISLPILKKADLLTLIIGADKSTITLTKKVLDYLRAQGIDSKNFYAILNRAVGLEGLTKAEAEEILDLPVRAALPYMGGSFALANNLNQPIILKYPENTASLVFKGDASDMIKTANKLRNM
jgi:MinD-like ATPase involved in chromosome partitioning or flagellar assembly/ActR/RegA family two-component response regulator